MLHRSGLIDDMGAEAMMMEALEKVEKEIKKPLLRSDKKNMGLLLAEFEKINKKYLSSSFCYQLKFEIVQIIIYTARLLSRDILFLNISVRIKIHMIDQTCNSLSCLHDNFLVSKAIQGMYSYFI